MDNSSQDNQLLPDTTSQQASQDRFVLNSALPSRNVEEHHKDRSSYLDTGGYEQSGSSNDNLLKETSQDIFDQDWDKEADYHRSDENQMQQSSVFSQQLCEGMYGQLLNCLRYL